MDRRSKNNLIMTADRSKRFIVDFTKNHANHTPQLLNDRVMEVVRSTRFMSVPITPCHW